MIIYFYLLTVPLLFSVDSSSIRGRSSKNELVPLTSSGLDGLEKENDLKVISNEPFIVQLHVPKQNDSKQTKETDTKRKRPTKKRVSELRKKHRARRDLLNSKSRRTREGKSNPPETPSAANATLHQKKNVTKNSISRAEMLKTLSLHPRERQNKRRELEANLKDNGEGKNNTEKAQNTNLRQRHPLADKPPLVKMIYPSTPKLDRHSHKYTYKDMMADRKRLEQKINYLKNMLSANDSSADDAVRIRRSDSDRTANKIAKMFLTLSAVNGLRDKRKLRCKEDDDGRVQDVWEKERRNSPYRKASSSNAERYKVKKWIEFMKNKRSSGKTCPCMANLRGDDSDVFPLEQKLPKDYFLMERSRSSEESSETYGDPYYNSRDKPNRDPRRRFNKGQESQENKLKAKNGKKKIELPFNDLELYRSRAKQILQNAEDILDKIKEEEEKRMSTPNILLSQLKELTSRIQSDPRNNENDLIRKLQKNLGWDTLAKSSEGSNGNAFVDNVKSYILDPYEKAKALTDESTKMLASYLLRNLGKMHASSNEEAGKQTDDETSGEGVNRQIYFGQAPTTEEKPMPASLAKEESQADHFTKAKQELQNWEDTISTILQGADETVEKEQDLARKQEEIFKNRMEDIIVEQQKKLADYETSPHPEENSGEKQPLGGNNVGIELKEKDKNEKEHGGPESLERSDANEKDEVSKTLPQNLPEENPEIFEAEKEIVADPKKMEEVGEEIFDEIMKTINENDKEIDSGAMETEIKDPHVGEKLETLNEEAEESKLLREEEKEAKNSNEEIHELLRIVPLNEMVVEYPVQSKDENEQQLTQDETGEPPNVQEISRTQEMTGTLAEQDKDKTEGITSYGSPHLPDDDRPPEHAEETYDEQVNENLRETFGEASEGVEEPVNEGTLLQKPLENEMGKESDFEDKPADPEDSIEDVREPLSHAPELLEDETKGEESVSENKSVEDSLERLTDSLLQKPELSEYEMSSRNDDDTENAKMANSEEPTAYNEEQDPSNVRNVQHSDELSSQEFLENTDSKLNMDEQKIKSGESNEEQEMDRPNLNSEHQIDETVEKYEDDIKAAAESGEEEVGNAELKTTWDNKEEQEEYADDNTDTTVKANFESQKNSEESPDENIKTALDEQDEESSEIEENAPLQAERSEDETIENLEGSNETPLREVLENEEEMEGGGMTLREENPAQETGTRPTDENTVKDINEEIMLKEANSQFQEFPNSNEDELKNQKSLDVQNVGEISEKEATSEEDQSGPDGEENELQEARNEERDEMPLSAIFNGEKQGLDAENPEETVQEDMIPGVEMMEMSNPSAEIANEDGSDKTLPKAQNEENLKEDEQTVLKSVKPTGREQQDESAADDEGVNEASEVALNRQDVNEVNQDGDGENFLQSAENFGEESENRKSGDVEGNLQAKNPDEQTSEELPLRSVLDGESLESTQEKTNEEENSGKENPQSEKNSAERSGEALKAAFENLTEGMEEENGDENSLKAAVLQATEKEVQDPGISNEDSDETLKESDAEVQLDRESDPAKNAGDDTTLRAMLEDEEFGQGTEEGEEGETYLKEANLEDNSQSETDADDKAIVAAVLDDTEFDQSERNSNEDETPVRVSLNDPEAENLEENLTEDDSLRSVSFENELESTAEGSLLKSAEAIEEYGSEGSEETVRAEEKADDLTEEETEDEAPLKSVAYDEINGEISAENGFETSREANPLADNLILAEGSPSRDADDQENDIPSLLQATPKPSKTARLKLPKSIGEIMKGLDGREKDDITSIQNLDSDKIDHMIGKIDEAEQQNLLESPEVDCMKECACADEINARSRNIGRYEIAKDFLHWMKDLQLNRVLSDD